LDCILYYLKNTGIPVNFGITITIVNCLGLWSPVNFFICYGWKPEGSSDALKAIGRHQLEADRHGAAAGIYAGVMGFGLGTGMAAAFFENDPPENSHTRNHSDVAERRDYRRLHLVRRHHRQSSEYPGESSC